MSTRVSKQPVTKAKDVMPGTTAVGSDSSTIYICELRRDSRNPQKMVHRWKATKGTKPQSTNGLFPSSNSNTDPTSLFQTPWNNHTSNNNTSSARGGGNNKNKPTFQKQEYTFPSSSYPDQSQQHQQYPHNYNQTNNQSQMSWMSGGSGSAVGTGMSVFAQGGHQIGDRLHDSTATSWGIQPQASAFAPPSQTLQSPSWGIQIPSYATSPQQSYATNWMGVSVVPPSVRVPPQILKDTVRNVYYFSDSGDVLMWDSTTRNYLLH